MELFQPLISEQNRLLLFGPWRWTPMIGQPDRYAKLWAIAHKYHALIHFDLLMQPRDWDLKWLSFDIVYYFLYQVVAMTLPEVGYSTLNNAQKMFNLSKWFHRVVTVFFYKLRYGHPCYVWFFKPHFFAIFSIKIICSSGIRIVSRSVLAWL